MTADMREAIVTIEEFLRGTLSMYTWDDFLSVPPRDPLVTTLQGFCRQLRSDYPPTNSFEYCSEAGKARLRRHLEELATEDAESSH
jgi:hypothetical protein